MPTATSTWRTWKPELVRYRDRPLKIGSFSAASNVTGILSDTRAISVLLHRHGALSFWDFAAAAPYVEIEMQMRADGLRRRDDPTLAYKDAIFLSPHKFIGGPGTPGVLVARRELFRNRVPSVVGGGTVAYVNPLEHVYLSDIEHREEGGTPAIVESIRAGLVFQLKEAVGVDAIAAHESDFIRRAIATWSAHPNIEILGNHDAERLSIVSFVVRHEGRYLHHNFVVALLNDLFGIQSRGGCSCAGPYGHRLLGIDIETLARVRARDLARLRGHQARLGSRELQLLHQRRRCSSSSSRRSRWSRARAGSCCRSTGSSRRPGSGATATGSWSRRSRSGRFATRTAR